LNTKAIVLSLTIFMTLILGACSTKEEIQNQTNAQQNVSASITSENIDESDSTTDNGTPNTSIADNKNIESLVDEINTAKEEISKNNKLTEEEMLSIGREIRQNSMKDFYNLNNDDDLDAYLTRYFLDEEPHYEAYKAGYPSENEKYNKGEVKLENEKVEHYGETGFVYSVKETQIVYPSSGNEPESQIYLVTMNVDKDDDGTYKIAAEKTEKISEY